MLTISLLEVFDILGVNNFGSTIVKGVVKASWKESGLSALKIVATALAAVTIAIITRKLDTVTSGLIIAGVVPVLSALFGEFYKVVFRLTAIGTKKIVTPIVSNLTTQSEPLSVTVAVSRFDDTGVPDLTKNVDNQISGNASLVKRIFLAVKTYFEENKYMKLAIFFTVVMITTTIVSYVISNNTKSVETIHTHTTTTINKKESITDDEKQSIIDSARNAVSHQSHSHKTQTLQEEFERLKEENMNLSKRVDSLEHRQSGNYGTQLEKLEAKVSELENEIHSQVKPETNQQNSESGGLPTKNHKPEERSTPQSRQIHVG